MRFSVDAWDPGYGSSVQDAAETLAVSKGRVDIAVETPAGAWAPIAPRLVPLPTAVLFVDGVLRIDARVWVNPHGTGDPSMGICGSYAAGVVHCSAEGAHITTTDVRRAILSTASEVKDVATPHGTWAATQVALTAGRAPGQDLTNALQRKLAELEVVVAANARGNHDPEGDDLLVLDGPLRGRTKLVRCVSLIKSHHANYLPAEVAPVVGRLDECERTPIFKLGTTWERYTWYLRLPGPKETAWSGIVRLECSTDLSPSDAKSLATLSQRVLPRYASEPHKDPRAPQNLYPISGLESRLHHLLGNSRLLMRSLRLASHGSA